MKKNIVKISLVASLAFFSGCGSTNDLNSVNSGGIELLKNEDQNGYLVLNSEYNKLDRANPQNSIVIDARSDDWVGINPLASSNGDEIKVSSDENNVYILFENKAGVQRHSVFMLNTDNNSKTGYQSNKWSSSGFDYLIGTNGNIYKMTTNSSQFSIRYVGSSVEYKRDNDTIELKIKKSDLSIDKEFGIVEQTYNDDWNVIGTLPLAGDIARYLEGNNPNPNPNPNPNEDKTAPVITLNGNATITLNKGEAYVEQGAVAVDDVDGDVNVVISGRVDTNRVGRYTITYRATDSAGNRATKQRVVNVVDNAPNPNDSIYIVNSNNPVEPNVVIHDPTPRGAHYEYIYDNQLKGYTLRLHSHWIENSHHILGYDAHERYVWNEYPEYQNKLNISWDAKFSGDYIIYVVVDFRTKDGQLIHKDLVYTPTPNGYENYTGNFMHIYLPHSNDGKWHHYHRNLLADVRRFYPGATMHYIENQRSPEVNGLAVRGSGYITNIVLSK